jgi:hypothetical protein
VSGIDPTSFAIAGTGPQLAALIEAELSALAADGAALRQLLTEGAVVQARVLPPNGLTDLIQIAGLRVAAALPPNLTPGDTIVVAVSGLENDQIQVQILPENTPLTSGANAAPVVPPTPASNAGQTNDAQANAAQTNAARPDTAGAQSPVAPSAAVFVAAAVRQAELPPTPPPLAPGTPETSTLTESSVPRGAPPVAPRAASAAPARFLGAIEARLATARAAVFRGLTPGARPPDAPVAAPRTFVAPPILTRGASTPAAPGVPTSPTRAAKSGPVPAKADAAARGLAVYREPVALLRALRLAVTPGNVASAKTALETPERLPEILATLERALPNSADPRVTTLRTLLGFVSRLDPKAPTFATQIAAYVDQAVEGSEPKLAALLTAQLASAGREEDSATPAAATPLPQSLPTVALATAAERASALDYTLKEQLISLAADPLPAGGAALADAVGGALVALTALQVNAASTLAANPEGIAFTLPIALESGVALANVTIDRDAPQPRATPLDGDNFHIAFVLETQHLGVVAIDLLTVGRTVTLDVKTEALLAAQRFQIALGDLTARLESLHYTVASANAGVAARGTIAVVPTAEPAAPRAPRDPNSVVDQSA